MGVATSLAETPRGRVVDLVGSHRFDFDVAIDPLPAGAPTTISVVIDRVTSLAAVVDDIVAAIATAVIDLFPAWLPGAESLDDSGPDDAAAMIGLTRRLAATGDHSVSALNVLARAGRSRRRIRRGGVPLETLVRECGQLLADTYHRPHVCLAVSRGDGRDDDRDAGWTPAEQQTVAAACEWLAQHGNLAVCLIGDPLPDIDRFTPMAWPEPAVSRGPEPAIDPNGPQPPTAVVVRLPALEGRPHPSSLAEQRLHAYLSRQEWASGARWNMTFAPHSLQSPIRVDVAWPDAKCIVEIDGDDHRAVAKYAADRQRDNMLQLAGYTVLRFVNNEVLDDISAVAATIERCLRQRQMTESTT